MYGLEIHFIHKQESGVEQGMKAFLKHDVPRIWEKKGLCDFKIGAESESCHASMGCQQGFFPELAQEGGVHPVRLQSRSGEDQVLPVGRDADVVGTGHLQGLRQGLGLRPCPVRPAKNDIAGEGPGHLPREEQVVPVRSDAGREGVGVLRVHRGRQLLGDCEGPIDVLRHVDVASH